MVLLKISLNTTYFTRLSYYIKAKLFIFDKVNQRKLNDLKIKQIKLRLY